MARLSTLLAAWDEWDVDQLLPPAERRLTRLPEGGREALGVLYHALRSELDELDELGAPEEREVVAVPAAVGAAGSAPGSTGG